jgi:hypothetical protein
MDSQSPISQYDTLLSSNPFIFLVCKSPPPPSSLSQAKKSTVYRGHWCPFCMTYLKTLNNLSAPIAAKGGAIIAVTAEPIEHLSSTRKATGYEGLVIIDETNSLAKELKRRGVIDVAVSERKGYKEGMAQPAILVARVKGEGGGEEEREVLEKWAIVPSVMNMGGAKDRPDLVQVWENVQAKLAGKPVVHTKYSLMGFFGTMAGKIFGR